MSAVLDMTSALADLNKQQRQAVNHLHGPLLVLAGAGTGKTRVITTRIANLLSHGVNPASILAVSFTRKAGNEMRERMHDLVGTAAEKICVSTFHALGLSVLREHHNLAGLDRRFGICNSKQRLAACVSVLADVESDCPPSDPQHMLRLLSSMKNAGRNAIELMLSDNEAERRFGNILAAYDAELRWRQLVDLDDMIRLPLRLLEANPRLRAAYQKRFKYLLVDEFQDSNPLQNRLIRCLVGRTNNVCVVGDDDQSIYGFRGACRELILQFPSQYPRTKVMKLTANYRCSQQIVAVANAVIKESQQKRYAKRLVAARAASLPVRLVRSFDEIAERNALVTEISRVGSTGQRFQDICVLARTRRQLSEIGDALKAAKIPCSEKSGGVRVMTFHAAKGLEFPIVYMPGLTEGTLPHWNATREGLSAIEEERRLFYVGVTRAVEQLTLLTSDRRGIYPLQPSRFIETLLRQRLVEVETRDVSPAC